MLTAHYHLVSKFRKAKDKPRQTGDTAHSGL